MKAPLFCTYDGEAYGRFGGGENNIIAPNYRQPWPYPAYHWDVHHDLGIGDARWVYMARGDGAIFGYTRT